MSGSKPLPARPSLESLRKQAKKLARDVTAGDADAISRARVHLPHVDLPLTQRNAQLVIAREYGYAGWQDLTAEVSERLGTRLEWAATQARRVIHDNDIDQLKQLLAQYPALLGWQDEDDHGGLLGFATGAYGDAGDPERERWFTRAACAELLIDAGAVVMPSVCDGLIESRARGLLQLFWRKGVLPRRLKFLAARGDPDDVRGALDREGNDLAMVTEAFTCACRFAHAAVASLLLERCIALDPELGRRVDGSLGRDAFIRDLTGTSLDLAHATEVGPWKAFVMGHVLRAAHDGDLRAVLRDFERDRWLLDDPFVWFQQRLIEVATLNDRKEFIVSLLDLDPALLRRQPPPQSEAIEIAFTYAKLHLLPLLTRIWPVPDDLPHAAGIGNLSRVRDWFDHSGAPALGDLGSHYPFNDARARGRARDLHWSRTAQRILDVALAYSVINRHFDVADFLLEHGADINTNWNSHEPASILHHLVFLPNSYVSMQFLIDRGIDMTIEDYRWNAHALGWARYGKSDEELARWLEEAERQRSSAASGRPLTGTPKIPVAEESDEDDNREGRQKEAAPRGNERRRKQQ